MSTRGKKVLVGFLALGSLAVWLPQLLQAMRKRSEAPAEASQPAFIGGAEARGEFLDPPGESVSDATPIESQRYTPYGALVEDLRNILSERARRRGERLAEEPVEAPSAASDSPDSGSSSAATATEIGEPDPLSELGRFLDEHPWNAVLGGNDNARALFGSLSLGVGARLPGTGARIEAIEGGCVTLAQGEKRWRLERLAAPSGRPDLSLSSKDLLPGALPALPPAADPEPKR